MTVKLPEGQQEVVVIRKVYSTYLQEFAQPMPTPLSGETNRPALMLKPRPEGFRYLCDPSLKTPAIAFWEQGKDRAAVRTSIAFEEHSDEEAGKKSGHKAVTPDFS